MASEVVRRSPVADSITISEALTFLNLLKEKLVEFAAFDSDTFQDSFTAELEELILLIQRIPSDNVLIDIQAKETEDVNLEMIESLSEIRYAFYFIKKAFKEQKSIKNEFGQNDLRNARYSADNLISFMEDFIPTVEKYIAPLISNGYKAERVDTLKTELTELRAERLEQKKVIRERPVKTAERVKILNMIWDCMVLISDAADFVYMDFPEKREQFRLPQKERSASVDE